MSGRKQRGTTSRMAGGFIALPHVVVDSVAYRSLSYPARALLLEFARQLGADNNGRLLASGNYLRPRGWTSNRGVTSAKRELLDAGFIHETVMGHRPNKASWYAVTWYSLAPLEGYDSGAKETFRRGAFMDAQPLPKPKPTRQELYRKWDKKNASLTPGAGVGRLPTTPNAGAMRATFDRSPTPNAGDHLDIAICYGSSASSENRANVQAGQIAPAWALRGLAANHGKRMAAIDRLATARGIVLGRPLKGAKTHD